MTLYVHKKLPLSAVCLSWLGRIETQEAKYVECWPNTTAAWAGWSRFDIPLDRYEVEYVPF